MTMTTEMLTRRHLQIILALVIILGTATLAVVALGVLLLAALVLKTLFDCPVALVQTVNELVATGGPFVCLLLLAALLFLVWKATPRVLRFIRHELAWMQAQFTGSSPISEQGKGKDEREQATTVEGTVSTSSEAERDRQGAGQQETGATSVASTSSQDQTSTRANSRYRVSLPTTLKHLASVGS